METIRNCSKDHIHNATTTTASTTTTHLEQPLDLPNPPRLAATLESTHHTPPVVFAPLPKKPNAPLLDWNTRLQNFSDYHRIPWTQFISWLIDNFGKTITPSQLQLSTPWMEDVAFCHVQHTLVGDLIYVYDLLCLQCHYNQWGKLMDKSHMYLDDHSTEVFGLSFSKIWKGWSWLQKCGFGEKNRWYQDSSWESKANQGK